MQQFNLTLTKRTILTIVGCASFVRLYEPQLANAAQRSVMLFRPSVVRDLERAECLTGATVVCSVWSGYLDNPRQQHFSDWMKGRGIRVDHCHTSGHASIADVRRLRAACCVLRAACCVLRAALPNAKAVPVHLADRERFSTLISNVKLRGDAEWWEVV